MEHLIITKPEKCVGCNACVRTCPANEANITKMYEDGRFVTSIDPDKCIACGACINACTHGARDYIDDTEEAMSALAHDKLIVMVAPSIKTVLPTKWKGILDWFRSKGCIIYDVSFGADICTWAHLRTLEHNEQENIMQSIITQPCPAIVKYVEIYQPKLLQNLSPIHSPVACSVTYVKNYLRRTNPIMMLSPCVAKKFEFEETGLVEYNVTYKKLMEYFERNGIRISTNPVEDYEYKFDDMQGQLGSIYPRPGGFRDNLWLHNPDFNITTSEGVHKVYQELDLYAKMPQQKHPEVFDVLSCEFGCNAGPGSGTDKNIFEAMAIMRDVELEAKARRKTTGGLLRGANEDRLFKRFDEELRLADFIRSYRPTKPSSVPSEEQLEPIYKMMGKHTEEDRHYDCLACGYRSCREMAIAIFRGLNTSDNCVIHAKTVLLARHSMLQEQHERLAEITNRCFDLSGQLKQAVSDITSNMNTIGASTDATSERASVVNDLLKNIVAFCNGNQTMDANSVKTLVGILETTIDAFSSLDDNVNTTNESSSLIKSSIDKITKLVDSINETLDEALQPVKK